MVWLIIFLKQFVTGRHASSEIDGTRVERNTDQSTKCGPIFLIKISLILNISVRVFKKIEPYPVVHARNNALRGRIILRGLSTPFRRLWSRLNISKYRRKDIARR